MMIRTTKLDIKADHNIEQICQEIAHDYYDTERVIFENGDVVLDIGAHVGVFSCWLAKLHPQIHVYAYEAVPATFEYLKLNTADLPNVTAYNLAVDVKPEITIQHKPELAYCSSAHYGKDVVGAQEIKVKAISLDEILASHDKVKFLKLDCEGSEWDLLLESKLLDKVEYIGMELHWLPQYADKKDAIRAKLRPWFDKNKVSLHIVNKLEAEGV
jgi:FkbM family methyltransferase